MNLTIPFHNPKIDAYLSRLDNWVPELEKLRAICLDCMLTEELKWNIPCYTWHRKNIVVLYGLKECCALGFFKGVLLQDAQGILGRPGEHTQAGRWIKFATMQEIEALEPLLKEYIFEAIEVEKAGIKIPHKKTEDYAVAEEFQHKLDTMPALKAAFDALTPGRQRGYLLHFSAPKQSKTRAARVEKSIPHILEGRGLNELREK